MPNETKVSSSNIESIGFKDSDLYVRFKSGGVYIYAGAGKHFVNMLNASSVGKYLNQMIQPHYNCREI